MTVTMSQEKKEKLKYLCLEALNSESHTIRIVARVIGKIVSSLPGVDFVRPHYRSLEREQIQALSLNNGDFEGLVYISSLAKEELKWWSENVMHVNGTI